jgi:hypothetical protein
MLDKVRGALRSKTVWFNAVAIPVLATIFDQAQANLAALAPYLADDKMKVIAIVSIVGNVVLRGLTTQPLEHK